MKFFSDWWQLEKTKLAFMVEHWGIYLVLVIGLICLCAYVHFSKDDDNEL